MGIHLSVTLSTADLDLPSSMQLLCEWALFIHFSVTSSTADLVYSSSMQLLCEWALHIHFSVCTTVVLLSALQIWIYHPVCSCCMRELRSYTFVLLSALLIWFYHPVCSCSVIELRSYTFVLLPALLIWIYHPVCSCFERAKHLHYVSGLCPYTFVILAALNGTYHPLCSGSVGKLRSYTSVLISHFSVTFSTAIMGNFIFLKAVALGA